MPVLRLCNRMLARLSRASEPQLVAGLLVFLSKVFPLNERSGLNVLVGTGGSHRWTAYWEPAFKATDSTAPAACSTDMV